MEKSKSYQSSANYQQRNKTVVKSTAANPYGTKSYLTNNNNNDVNYKSNKFQVDTRKDEIVPISRDEEWTKSKKVVNHKTRQIETRIQRQIVMEDGKVIADSGPQVTQRTKEDIKTEELEGSSGRGGKGEGGDLPVEDYKGLPGEAVVSEKVETRNTTREARQEQLQYHDESIKELTGYDIHRKALVSPNELIQLDESEIDSSRPKGKLVHYAAKSKKFADREEMKEVSKRQRDGTITTEKTVTQHHEEVDDDELPEGKADSNAIPEASKESTKEIQYHRDWNDSRRSESRSKNVSEENERRENRYSSVDRKSENFDKSRSTSVDRRSTTSSQYNREKSIPVEKEYSPRVVSPDSRQSPNYNQHKSRFERHDDGYSVDNKYQQSSISRRDESRFSNRSVSSSIKEKPFKEDASVQASFSEDSSDDEAYGRTRNKKSTESEARSHRIKVESSGYSGSRLMESEKPKGSFYYFGQDADPKESPRKRELSSDRYSTHGSRLHREESSRASEERQQMKSSMSRSSSAMDKKETRTNRDSESVNWFNTLDARTLMDELERECQAELSINDPAPEPSSPSDHRSRSRMEDTSDGRSRYSTSGEIKGNVKHEFKSTSNGQVINDTSRNEAFQRSFNNPEEREDATRSFNKLMDTTFGKSSRESMSPLLYDGSIRHIPIERQDSSKSRMENSSRSSSTVRDNGYNSPSFNHRSYNNSRTNSPSRLSDRFRYSDARSPSRSPERQATFTKSRASPTINNNSDYSPYKSDLMRKSPFFGRENKNY